VRAPLIEAAFALGADERGPVTAVVEVGDRHPVEIAEEAAVVDLAGAGRLILVLRPAPGTESDFEEAVNLIRTALRGEPFTWPGPRWPLPPVRMTPGAPELLDRLVGRK
jgi:alkanesulfonate monooxygenase SsuD/methylene tetrahydromethanopterin reductase-like flavin-dependent oxidoreductase (luciferase family)